MGTLREEAQNRIFREYLQEHVYMIRALLRHYDFYLLTFARLSQYFFPLPPFSLYKMPSSAILAHTRYDIGNSISYAINC